MAYAVGIFENNVKKEMVRPGIRQARRDFERHPPPPYHEIREGNWNAVVVVVVFGIVWAPREAPEYLEKKKKNN